MKPIFAASLLAALVCTTASAQTFLSIGNPSFEDSIGNEPTGWTRSGGAAAHTQAVTDAAATNGANVGQVRGLHSTNATSGMSQALSDVFASGTYVLSFDAASRDSVSGTTSLYAGLFAGTLSQANTYASSTTLLTDGLSSPALASYQLEFELLGGPAIGQPIGIHFANAGADGVFLPGTQGEGLGSNLLWIDNIKLSFTAGSASVPGDANGNGSVGLEDFAYISDRLFNVVATPGSEGDLDFSGTVDFDDFGVWKSIYVPQAAAALGGDAVPEPASLAIGLLTAALAGVGLRRRC
ncbi:hypothetical protein Pla175_14010 [Pirellulimonas nuda]|uniref:Ice-binding protein C-terminal domain-containing protein n=1 Tax=Pirellulimonas nuda TaxID=2528009 RepID=A0A518D981_9BACT|nr:PEP-CTERM sorting domain-containing protein [Pirellulimonas nuda]QDU88031.1 hypothetical protein Pla175_14010 [Pirellulimonas nuda]